MDFLNKWKKVDGRIEKSVCSSGSRYGTRRSNSMPSVEEHSEGTIKAQRSLEMAPNLSFSSQVKNLGLFWEYYYMPIMCQAELATQFKGPRAKWKCEVPHSLVMENFKMATVGH